MEIPSPNPQSHSQTLSPAAAGSSSGSGSFPTSPEFEFWMVRNPSFPQPNLLSADELFVDGVLLPLHLLPNPKPDPDPADDGPKLTASSAEQGCSLTPSKRWSIFKKSEKKSNQEEKKKEKKTGNGNGNGSSSAELNINLWPFSRSRSAGNAFSRPKMFAGGQPGSRKVNSAPCSRSNSAGESKSRKWPSSPSRAGVHLGRSSPVWQVRRGGSTVKNSENHTDAHRSKTATASTAASAASAASRGRVLNLNVPMCIGYRNHLSCRSDEASAIGVVGGGGGGSNGGGVDGGSVGNSGNSSSTTTNLFSIRNLFTKKVH